MHNANLIIYILRFDLYLYLGDLLCADDNMDDDEHGDITFI